MALSDFLNLLTQIIYVSVAGSTLWDWAGRRDHARRDIALVFIALALAITAQDLQRLVPALAPGLALLFFVALLAQPYFLVRVTRYFRQLPARAEWAALGGLLLVYASLLLSQTAPYLVFSLAIGYFLAVESYATVLLVQGALTTPGITRRRLRLAAVGSGLLALVFFLTLGLVLVGLRAPVSPVWQTGLAALIQILAIGSGLSYYFGFAPPRWLRQAWRLGELHRFLQQASGRPVPDRSAAFEHLCAAALRTVGGAAATAARWEAGSQRLVEATPGERPLPAEGLRAEAGALGQAWRERRGVAAAVPAGFDAETAQWAGQLGAQALLVVPILSPLRPWGVLLVALRFAPLFAQDDLDLLRLLADQTALALDNAALIAELREANQSLELRVAERTADLARANRALRTISDCNQELAWAASEAELLNRICQIIVERGGYRLAWVGYAENDPQRTVRPVAQAGAGDGDGSLADLPLSWGDGETGQTPIGAAIRTGQPKAVHIVTEPVSEAWRAATLRQGYAACLALPLIAGDKAFGGVGIFAAEPDAFDPAEVKMLLDLANDLAFGITALRTRAAHAQAEADLLRSEELLRQTSRMAQVGGWELDVATLTPRWSEETYRLHEVDPTVQPDLENAINFYAPEARPLISAAVQQAIAEGVAYDLDLPFITATGRRRWVRTQGRAEFRDGRCVRVSGTFQDITERKQAEAALRQSQARLAGIIDSAMDAILSVDADQRVILFNAAAEQVFQCRAAAALGQPLEQFIPERFRAAHQRHIQAFGATGITNRRMGVLGDLRGLRANGQEFPIEASISHIDLADQKLFTVILRDVTERRRLEEEQRELIAKLERNNRELQDFAYVASHDLQEPLRKIMAFGDRLKTQSQTALDDKGRDYLARMQAAAARMRTLIDDLLTFSRVSTKTQPFARTDLAQVTREVLTDLEVSLEKSGGHVELGDLPAIDADPTQMRQALQNLIGNALKFHQPETPPRVKVYGVVDGAICRLYVADHGIGFDAKYLDRIFTPFQRLHGRGEYAGTGIGLAVVRKIAERHGGSITARSAPGQGATFILTLPVRQGG